MTETVHVDLQRTVSVAEARRTFAELLDAVEAGETIVITRRGEPVAQLGAVPRRMQIDVSWLREETAKIPYSDVDSGDLVRQMRDDARY